MIPYGIGRGFDKSRTNGWYIRVRGKKEYFGTEELRDGEYDRRIAEAKLYGERAGATLTPGDRQMLQELQRLASPTGYTPLEIFERGLTLVGRKPRNTATVAECVEKFLAETKRRHGEGLIGLRHYGGLRNMLTRFSERFGGHDMGTIGKEDVHAYIHGLGVGPLSRNNHARNISCLFTWAKDRMGVVSESPVGAMERVRRMPTIFTAKQAAKVFELASPELIPMLVFQWFAGIRPTATHGMRWGDVDVERGVVIIRAEISKLREPEIIEHLPDELWAWLKANAKRKGRIAPISPVAKAQVLHHALGYGEGKDMKPWPMDVARHSFASHLYPRLRSIDAVAKILCHRGSRVTLKHYVAKNVTAAESEAYFALIGKLRR